MNLYRSLFKTLPRALIPSALEFNQSLIFITVKCFRDIAWVPVSLILTTHCQPISHPNVIQQTIVALLIGLKSTWEVFHIIRMGQERRLPASFRSLYRLFLRTSTASVLHHPVARVNLRQRWRPIFNQGAEMTLDVAYPPDTQSSEWVHSRLACLQEWNDRSKSFTTQYQRMLSRLIISPLVDRTLGLLYSSCKSRGLPHQLTRNLSYFVTTQRQLIIAELRKAQPWQPHRTYPTTPLPYTKKALAAMEKKEAQHRFRCNTDLAINEVLRLAEGQGKLSLGLNVAQIKKRKTR